MTAAKIKPEVAEASRPDRRAMTRQVLVTPDTARDWLSKMTNNRPLNDRHVDNIADAIRRDQYLYSGDTIKFNTKGELIDGQHRLTAVISANKAVHMMIAEGLEEAAMNVIDTGRKRTAGDILSIAGYGSASVVAAAIRKLVAWKRGIDPNSLAFSNAQTFEFAQKNKNIFKMAAEVGQKIKYPRSVLIALYWLATEASAYEEEYKAFLSGMETGVGLPAGSPILCLRDWFARQKTTKGKAHGNTYMFAAIRAWNAFAESRSLSKIDCQSRPAQVTGENLNSNRRFK